MEARNQGMVRLFSMRSSRSVRRRRSFHSTRRSSSAWVIRSGFRVGKQDAFKGKRWSLIGAFLEFGGVEGVHRNGCRGAAHLHGEPQVIFGVNRPVPGRLLRSAKQQYGGKAT